MKDLQIKMEPISPDDSSFGWDEGNRKNVETISSSSLTDEIKAWNSELSLREDDLYNRPTLHQPTNFAESFQIDENQPEKVLDCSWHCDHSYSNTSKHLAGRFKLELCKVMFLLFSNSNTVKFNVISFNDTLLK